MTALAHPTGGDVRGGNRVRPSASKLSRAAPVTVAAVFALVYVLLSPPSGDLAAHMFRAHLFANDPFGVWNNYWYAGHHTVSYSLLYPAFAALLTPQLAAALAAVGATALFQALARRHFGADAWLGAALFAVATATDLYTGRLAFAFGALPAMAAVVALDRRRPLPACLLAALAALASPVAALFAAFAGAAYAVGTYARERRKTQALPGLAVAVAALAPVLVLGVLFPEGGTEPFAFSAFWPIPLLAVAFLIALPPEAPVLRAGIVIYTLATIASYLVATPVGSNVTRLGTMLAAPLGALLLWRRSLQPRTWHRGATLLALVAPALLYLGWQAPIRDLLGASGQASTSSAYYRPVVRFLQHQPGAPFRVEIPFTRFHWEAYAVATRFPLARGWERQLDIADNPLFYDGKLTASSYDAWLLRNGVRFVASSDAPLDYSARQESRLIATGLPYLHVVFKSAHWRVYAVAGATGMTQGVATVRSLGADWLTLVAKRAGRTLIRVRYTPYWKLTEGSGCISPAGTFTAVTLRRPGPARLAVSFAIDRIGARSPRCA